MMTNRVDDSLFNQEAVFVSHETDRKALFKEISAKLVDLGYVKNNFIEGLEDREENYPTGINMQVVATNLPNVAIPHTEGNYVNVRKIVPVKLIHPVKFNEMIDPSNQLQVSFLFMILNNDPEGQANVLSEIMDFLTQTDNQSLVKFFESDSTEQIYQYLKTNFKPTHNN